MGGAVVPSPVQIKHVPSLKYVASPSIISWGASYERGKGLVVYFTIFPLDPNDIPYTKPP